ncbi:phytanoyl-CoA dioxygenase family protein [Rhizobium leguminosarum]|uniref:phytanoyl-CoA dioxygenase family protein n=1 Tax=Rhizobium leguminosarum TaxID=384 RepID=UPI000FEC35F0|nr:phytanoyl-CoA dioxygenase family protein [Rhizobium leguminosarum]RWX22843.1 hypothetical protein EHI43_34900 [Rhizobium leguminosarum]
MDPVLTKYDCAGIITAKRYDEGVRAEFERSGFVAIAGAVHADVIDAHLAGAEQFARENPIDSPITTMTLREQVCRLRALHAFQERCDGTLNLQAAPLLVACLRQILQAEPAALFTTTFGHSPLAGDVDPRLPLSPHLHNFEFVTEPADKFVLAWIALEDISVDAGPMWLLPESHRVWAELPSLLNSAIQDDLTLAAMIKVAVGGKVSLETWSYLLDKVAVIARGFVERALRTQPIRPSPVIFEKGDALIFDPSLLHGTIPPANPRRTRKSCNIRYASNTCRIWNYLELVKDGRSGLLPEHGFVSDTEQILGGYIFRDFLGRRYRNLM